MTKDIATVLKQMEHLIIGDLNETYERYVFNSRKQREDETIDTFVTELSTLAKSHGFCDCMADSVLRDRIVMGVKCVETRKKLISTKKLRLSMVIDICRAAEATARQMESLSQNAEVHAFRQKNPKTKPPRRPRPGHYSEASSMKECKFCGTMHEMVKSKCPAYSRSCKCHGQNHFTMKCPKETKPVHIVQEADLDTGSWLRIHLWQWYWMDSCCQLIRWKATEMSDADWQELHLPHDLPNWYGSQCEHHHPKACPSKVAAHLKINHVEWNTDGVPWQVSPGA